METSENSTTDTNIVNDSSFHQCDNYSDFYVPDFLSLATFENLRHSSGWSIFYVIAYVMVFCVGLIGNVIVILVIVFKPPLQTVSNMFLLNLAIADLLVTIFCVPATLLANLFTPWTLGSIMCKAVAYVQGVAVCASAYSLIALSIERCCVIYWSMERHPGISKRQALLAIIVIWIFSSLITLPWPFTFEVIKEDCQIYCYEVWTNETLGRIYFLLAHLISCYCIPLVVICSSNIAIWCYVSKRQPRRRDSVSLQRIQKRTRKGLRRTIGTVTSAFLICWLPLYVLATIIKFSPEEGIGEFGDYIVSIIFPFAQWLGSVNSGVNPVIYAFFNRKFRKSFWRFVSSVAVETENRISSVRSGRRPSQAVAQQKGPYSVMDVNVMELADLNDTNNMSEMQTSHL